MILNGRYSIRGTAYWFGKLGPSHQMINVPILTHLLELNLKKTPKRKSNTSQIHTRPIKPITRNLRIFLLFV